MTWMIGNFDLQIICNKQTNLTTIAHYVYIILTIEYWAKNAFPLNENMLAQ